MTSLASALSAEPRRYPAVINIHGFARLDAHCLEKQRILRCSPAPKRASSFILDPQRPPKLLRCCRNQSSNSACRFQLGNGYAVAVIVPSRALRSPIFSRSEEHTSELQSLMRISYAVFCLKKKTTIMSMTTPIHAPSQHH